MDLERLKRVAQTLVESKKVLVVLTAAVASASGAFAGYVLADKRAQAKYAKISEAEIAAARNFYYLEKKPEFKSPIEAAEALIPEDERYQPMTEAMAALEKYGKGIPTSEMINIAKSVKRNEDGAIVEVELTEEAAEVNRARVKKRENVFDTPEEPEFDYSEEVKLREGQEKYIISKAEYFEGEKDYNQCTLTYFEKDDTLADDRNDVCDVEETIGTENIRFGYGSEDRNIVYIRNEKLGLDMEILRSFGSFAQEVYGFDPDEEDEEKGLQHSGVRKFRPDRE